MGPLVVPMNPEFFPEAALLLGGTLAGAIAIHLLFTRQLGRGMRVAAISVTCIILAFVLARTHSGVRRNHAASSAEPAGRGDDRV